MGATRGGAPANHHVDDEREWAVQQRAAHRQRRRCQQIFRGTSAAAEGRCRQGCRRPQGGAERLAQSLAGSWPRGEAARRAWQAGGAARGAARPSHPPRITAPHSPSGGGEAHRSDRQPTVIREVFDWPQVAGAKQREMVSVCPPRGQERKCWPSFEYQICFATWEMRQHKGQKQPSASRRRMVLRPHSVAETESEGAPIWNCNDNVRM